MNSELMGCSTPLSQFVVTFCRPALPIVQALDVGFWQNLPFGTSKANGRQVPDQAIPCLHPSARGCSVMQTDFPA